MRALFLLCVLLFGSLSAAEAQSLKIPLTVYAGAAALDLHSTHRMLQYEGFRELNPITGWLDHREEALVVVSAAFDVAACAAIYHAWGKHHRKAARGLIYAVAAVRIGLAIHNYRAVQGWAKEKRIPL